MDGEKVKMKRFDKAFKVQAVKMVTEEGQKGRIVNRQTKIPGQDKISCECGCLPLDWKE